MYFLAPEHINEVKTDWTMKATYINYSYFAFASKYFFPFPNTFDFVHTTKTFLVINSEIPTLIIQAPSNIISHLLSSSLSIVKSPVVTELTAFSSADYESSLLSTQMFSIFNKKPWMPARFLLRGQIFMCLQAELWLQKSLCFLLAMFSKNSALHHPYLVWILHQDV